MRKNLVTVLLILAAVVAMTACDKELKPTKPGVFVAANNKLTEWTPVVMDEEATPEGFFLPFFKGEVNTILRFHDRRGVP